MRGDELHALEDSVLSEIEEGLVYVEVSVVGLGFKPEDGLGVTIHLRFTW